MKRALLQGLTVATLVALAAPVRATPSRHAVIAGELALDLDTAGDLWVRRGTARARVPVELPYPDLLVSVHARSAARDVVVTVEANCNGVQTLTLGIGRLEALLENAAGRALLGTAQWDAAAAGFERALALDPTFSDAATNLAAAQARGGHGADATTTLASAAGRDPIWVAWRLAADPDLAALVTAPPLATLYAPSSGPASPHRATKLDGAHVAFSRSRGLYAWRRVQRSAMGGRRVDDQLWIADVATGAVRARLDYGHDRRGAAAVEKTLATLGFAAIVDMRRLQPDDSSGNDSRRLRASLASDHLELVLEDGSARLSRRGRVVGRARFEKPKGADSPSWIEPWAAPIAGAVVIGAGVTIGDGCGAWSYDEVLRIRDVNFE